MRSGAECVAWDTLRARRAVLLALVASLLPVTVASVLVLQGRGLLVALAWTTAIGLACAYEAAFRCPRCRKVFGKRDDDDDFGAIVVRCVHCGIRAGTPKSAP